MGHFKVMSLKEIILQLVQLAILFGFPTIWNWIMRYISWWPLDPQTTLGLVISIVVAVVSWILGIIGIKKLVIRMKAQRLVK